MFLLYPEGPCNRPHCFLYRLFSFGSTFIDSFSFDKISKKLVFSFSDYVTKSFSFSLNSKLRRRINFQIGLFLHDVRISGNEHFILSTSL